MAFCGHLVFFLCLIMGLPSVSNEVDVPVPGCPPHWTRLGSRCFIYQNDHKNAGTAEKICISLGGNLASIHSEEESLFVRELVHQETGSYPHMWSGGYDGILEGTWMWTDGSNFDYKAWGPNEPNNYGVENCLELGYAGHYWNDAQCQHTRPFVCAKNL